MPVQLDRARRSVPHPTLPMSRATLPLFAGLLATTLLFAGLIVTVSVETAFAVALGLGVCLLTFLKPRYGLYILVFSMLLSPEFGQRTTLGQGVTLRVDDFLLLFIGLSWLAKTAVNKRLGLFRKTPLNLPIAIYLLLCVLATAMGILLGDVGLKSGFFFVLKYFEYFVVYFMVVNHVHNRKHVVLLVGALLLTCLVVDLVAISQIPSGRRLTAPFEGAAGEPNTFGGYLVLLISLTLALLANLKAKKVRAALLLLFCLSVPPLLLTLSRGSYVAMVPAFFCLLFLCRQKGALVLLLLLAVLAAPFILPQKVVKRISYTISQSYHAQQEQIGQVRLDTSTSMRLKSWGEGFTAACHRPLLGYGVTGWQFMDNQLIKVLVETGFLGLAAFLFLLFSIFKEGLRIRAMALARQDPLFSGVSIGMLAGFTGLLVHSLGANTFIIVRIMEPFWLLTGLVMVMPAILAQESGDQSAGSSVRPVQPGYGLPRPGLTG